MRGDKDGTLERRGCCLDPPDTEAAHRQWRLGTASLTTDIISDVYLFMLTTVASGGGDMKRKQFQSKSKSKSFATGFRVKSLGLGFFLAYSHFFLESWRASILFAGKYIDPNSGSAWSSI